MTDLLAEVTARGAALLLSGVGIPAERSGSLISCGGRVSQVTADCAGVRICLAFLLFSVMLRLFGDGRFRAVVWALPLAVLVNVVRASVAVACPAWHDPIGLFAAGVGYMILLVVSSRGKNGKR